jgi:Flp pilus assembly protein TadD
MRGQPRQALRHMRLALAFGADNQTRALYAQVLYAAGERRQAVSELRRVALLQPDLPEVLNNLAWLLATTSDAQLRDGIEAVRCAKRACRLTEYKRTEMVGTLAAAYAEAGQFHQAVSCAKLALKLSKAGGQTRFIELNQHLLALYRSGRAWHESPPPD